MIYDVQGSLYHSYLSASNSGNKCVVAASTAPRQRPVCGRRSRRHRCRCLHCLRRTPAADSACRASTAQGKQPREKASSNKPVMGDG